MKKSFLHFFLLLIVGLFLPPAVAQKETSPQRLFNIQNPRVLKKMTAKALRILVWNIYKAKRAPYWQQDFAQLQTAADLILLQEGIEAPSFLEFMSQFDFGLSHARSFFSSQYGFTGVMTAYRQPPLQELAVLSPSTEPVAATPKMALVQLFQMEDHLLPLMVINIHSLNFVRFPYFRQQIEELLRLIEQHPGPLLFAGDFNTWSQERLNYLKNALHTYRLEHVKLNLDSRNRPLDHIFVRGCTVLNAELHSYITSSDHAPLTAHFNCDSTDYFRRESDTFRKNHVLNY